MDLLIFGATGFTGLHMIPYVARLTKQNGRNLSWGVAGRSEGKLRKVLKDAEIEVGNGANFDQIPIVIADQSNHESLVAMAKRAKLLIDCVGPYHSLGEAAARACIEAGTHRLDLSGEAEYMEKLQIEQHENALAKGVYIISACGMDSIPTDMGIIFLQQNFEGTLNSIQTYLKVWVEGHTKGPAGNIGTYESAVYALGSKASEREVRTRFYQKYKKAPVLPPKLKTTIFPHRKSFIPGWSVPFLGADEAIAVRSQSYFYEHENQRPIQVATYFTLPSFLNLIGYLFIGACLMVLSKCRCGRNLLLNHPSFFTGGYFGKEQPAEETIQNTWFSIDFYGEGWREKLPNKDDKYPNKINRVIRGKITGQNPAYGSTCLITAVTAIVVLTETEKMANNGRGGIYPPGAAFAHTSLIDQLKENGLPFEIISQQDV